MKKTFPATLEQLYPMLDFVHAFCGHLQIRLAVEEPLVNIIQHGYPNENGFIEISCEKQENGFRITIKDRGVPFDPVQYTSSKIDGIGISLMKKIMDQVEYKRWEEENILTMVKHY